MKNNTMLDSLLLLYANVTAILDTKEKKIDTIYNKNTMVGTKKTYEDFAEYFVKQKNLDQKSKGKILRFMHNLNTSNEPFSQSATFHTENGESRLFEFKGLKYDETHTMLIIGDFVKEATESHDSLTKVLARETMIEKVKAAISNKQSFALMIIDIDNFKLFNDTYGHMFGDIVLVETAASIKKNLGKGYVGRIGGDEFLVLAYVENNYEKIHAVCRTIRQSITNVSTHNIKQAVITATIGCTYYPKDAKDYETLFKKADLALYRGKRKGRNCFIIYDEAKCGKITDNKTALVPTMELYQTSISANIVAGIFEILNREGAGQKNIDDSLSLIGNYFLLDRIALISVDPERDVLAQVIEWDNPKMPELKNSIDVKESNFIEWRKSLDNTGMLKYVQVNSNKDNSTLYKILLQQKTSAILAFELRYMNRILGLIRYDMCSINRFWQQSDISALMLISKIFSIYLNNQYEKKLHFNELNYDRLTHLFNYTRWRDEVYQVLSSSTKQMKYALLYFHISGFVNLNEIYGTNNCDKALKYIGQALTEIMNQNEIYCRVSQDKFIVFFPNGDQTTIEEKFNRITTYLDEHTQTKNRFNLCAGIYLYHEGDTLTTAIDKANLARQQIHSATKSQFSYFHTKLYEEKRKITEIELHMREALENDEFLLYLQPKVDTSTNTLVGAEALTRWYYKKETLLTPDAFIPIFESNGFITDLDFKVFENVCVFLQDCRTKNLPLVKISVNVSRYQTNFKNYIDTINSIRNQYDIPSSYIDIEITEGMYTDNQDEIKTFIDLLHQDGYTVSMDDFGQGYSNLSSLATLDFDLIKLDKSFCRNLDQPKERKIVEAITKLIQSLNTEVLCEGVETKEFADLLKEIGCTLVQGYLYDAPLPKEAFLQKYFIQSPLKIQKIHYNKTK